jgi:hypothetical protein
MNTQPTLKAVISRLPNFEQLSSAQVLDIAEHFEYPKRVFVMSLRPKVFKLVNEIPHYYKIKLDKLKKIANKIDELLCHIWANKTIRDVMKIPEFYTLTFDQLMYFTTLKPINEDL